MSELPYRFCQVFFTWLPRLASRIYRDGMDHVPAEGAGLIIANHISHFDPPLMTIAFPRVIHFMADKPLLDLPLFGRLFRAAHVFPIDRTKNDRGALRTAMARLEAGAMVAIFPEKGIRHGRTSVLGGAELPIGTASLWKMMDVPVVPMVILGTDQLYAWQNLFRRPRLFFRVGPPLPPDKNATREELRYRIAHAWRELYDAMLRDYQIRPDELPQSAQERWGRPAPPQPEPVSGQD